MTTRSARPRGPRHPTGSDPRQRRTWPPACCPVTASSTCRPCPRPSGATVTTSCGPRGRESSSPDPTGLGKTTLAGNLIQARLGLGGGTVLGLPVQSGKRKVLVLLMDRPQQAMAALARLFTKADRGVLRAPA